MDQLNADQFILVLQLRRHDGTFDHLEFSTLYLLDHALLRRKHQPCITHLLAITQVNDLFTGAVKITHIIYRNAFITELSIRKIL